jgi:hypothetical protein
MRGRLLFTVLVAAGALANAALAAAPTETIRLHPQHGAMVTGSATIGASGAGTAVSLDLRGLTPGSSVRALLHAGTCAHFGAIFAGITTATANATGLIHARGRILFLEMSVDYGAIADGAHVITIVSGSRVVACGVIPGMS